MLTSMLTYPSEHASEHVGEMMLDHEVAEVVAALRALGADDADVEAKRVRQLRFSGPVLFGWVRRRARV